MDWRCALSWSACPRASLIRRGKKLVVIQPFSGRAIKNWPLQDFLRLGGWLTREMATNTVLLGTKAEAALAPDIADQCVELGVRSLIGETSLAEAIKVISEADLFVGNDSGLTHIAARFRSADPCDLFWGRAYRSLGALWAKFEDPAYARQMRALPPVCFRGLPSKSHMPSRDRLRICKITSLGTPLSSQSRTTRMRKPNPCSRQTEVIE